MGEYPCICHNNNFRYDIFLHNISCLVMQRPPGKGFEEV